MADDTSKQTFRDPGLNDELGYSGLDTAGGHLSEEFLRQLQGERGRKVYREMADNDPVVGAILFAIDKLIRQVSWSVEAANTDRAGQEAAALLESCMEDMTHRWSAFVSEVLVMLEQGFSVFEPVYKKREDGKIGWLKLAPRAPETINRWEFDDNGDILGAYQLGPPLYKEVFLDINRILLFRTTSRKNSPEGRSILRNAYIPWYRKSHVEMFEGIGVERDMAGLPVLKVPRQIMGEGATDAERAEYDYYTKAIKRLRRNEQAGMILPSDVDHDTKEPLYKMELLSAGGRRQFDTGAIVTRYDQRIAGTVLADFILLGQAAVGSFALSSDKTEMFAVAIGSFLQVIREELNDVAVARLMRINGYDKADWPWLVNGDLEERDLDKLSAFVERMVSAGVFAPDDRLESYMRRAAKLPELDQSEGGL